jgi:hypothetical protein
MPSSFWGMFWYSYRIGNSLADMRRKFPGLWQEQIKRIPILDYAIFGLTRYKFSRFWKELNFTERLVFIYSRLVTMTGFYLGFWSIKRSEFWDRIEETKRSF